MVETSLIDAYPPLLTLLYFCSDSYIALPTSKYLHAGLG
jgi:hypothetical protein